LCSANCKCEIKISSGDSSDTTETTDEELEEDTTETKETTTEKKEEVKTTTTVEDKDGISTQQDRLALPKEPKKGIFGRVWNWFLDIFR